MSFSLLVKKQDAVFVLTAKGYVHLDEGMEIRKKVHSYLEQGEKVFLVDFTEAPIITSLALSQILEMVAEVISNDSLVVFAGLSSTAKITFQTVGLLEYATDYETIDEALTSLKGK